MSWLLREVNRNRWIEVGQQEELDADDLPASNLNDLRTGNNALSLFFVDDSDKEQSINRIAVALVIKKYRPGNFDYLLIKPQVVRDAGFEIRQTEGMTKDTVVNTWHRDIPNLSAAQIVEIAVLFARRHDEVRRLQQYHIIDLIKDAVTSNHIQYSDLSDKFQEEIPEPTLQDEQVNP